MEGKERSLEDYRPSLTTAAELQDALRMAVDYRGDITIGLKDGSSMEGYIFTKAQTNGNEVIRLYPKGSESTVEIRITDIQDLFFSGRDTAFGKSWEAWIAKYKGLKPDESNRDDSP